MFFMFWELELHCDCKRSGTQDVTWRSMQPLKTAAQQPAQLGNAVNTTQHCNAQLASTSSIIPPVDVHPCSTHTISRLQGQYCFSCLPVDSTTPSEVTLLPADAVDRMPLCPNIPSLHHPANSWNAERRPSDSI